MEFSIATLARLLSGSPPDVVCSHKIWHRGVDELRRRTNNSTRESGAFLLGRKEGAQRWIEEFVYYDDIDPHALDSGIVNIDGRRLGALWKHCRTVKREVVADVHLHPFGYGQSPSDQENPIMAEVGHMAFIIPYYAQRATGPSGIGVFRYKGGFRWDDLSRSRLPLLHLGWWPRWS